MPPKSGKKGLTLEEKRSKLLEFFTKEHMFYNIKDIETQGSKYVGIHPIQVKEILQTLLDDNLVSSEKCGIAILYWCFEYDKYKKMDVLISARKEKYLILALKRHKLKETLNDAKSIRKRTDAPLLISKINELTQKRDSLRSQLDSTVFDSNRVDAIKMNLVKKIMSGQSATDNIELLIYYFKKNSGIDREYFKQEFGIPEEFREFPQVDLVFSKLT